MKRGAVAANYAEALFGLASQQNAVDAVEEELRGVIAVIKGERNLFKVLNHPRITPEEKKQIVVSLFGDKVSKLTLNFLRLVIDRHREAFLPEMVDEFIKLANRARNIVEVSITSAVEMDAEQKKKLEGKLAKMTGKRIRPSYHVDPDLIGGVVVRIGDKVIDGSVRARLNAIREHLRQIG